MRQAGVTARKQYKNLYRACVVCLLESLLFNDKAIFNGGVSCEHIRFLAFFSRRRKESP